MVLNKFIRLKFLIPFRIYLLNYVWIAFVNNSTTGNYYTGSSLQWLAISLIFLFDNPLK